MANIRLNILPVIESDFTFKVYRKIRQPEDEKEAGTYFYNLPKETSKDDKQAYWVCIDSRDGYEEYKAHSLYALGLTKHYLARKLVETLKAMGCDFSYNHISKKFREEIEFTLHEFPKGKQVISLSPYYLEEHGKFGFIVDFYFVRKKDVKFDKEVQILSLSLDRLGRSNKNYYTDKFRITSAFIDKIYPSIHTIDEGESNIHIGKDLLETPVYQLNKKEYIFSNKNTSNSQFQGIRNYGPLERLSSDVTFVFIFEEHFKSFANELYLSLTGKSNPGTFPGLEQMFGIKMSTNNVKQIRIEGHSNEQLASIVTQVENIQKSDPSKKVIGIYIEDYSIDDDDLSASYHYYFLKYHFIKKKLPLQVVNYRKLGEKNALKWSTSNLSLAMFAKLGGIPWIVKPSNNNCLILGIGSSHRRDAETGEISKYFAYTVCLDSSGLYKTLAVLADETTEIHYLENLKTNLINLFKDGRLSNYKTCVLHIPFKIKQKEINAIAEAIAQVNHLSFVTIKVNIENKYFGYSFHNTLVPYESSFVQLSQSEFLVWFEGLQYGKEVVDKRLSNPVHLQFLSIGNTKGLDEKNYLQDVLNLSGANWRGFNAKSIPISIYYSQIIAKYTEAFEKIEGYQEDSISNDKPWFL